MKKILPGLLLTIFFIASISSLYAQNAKEVKVLISTSMGDIKLKLYNETPIHRDNFIKLVNNHTYDSVLFHRVIKDFMIQSGDPESKSAKPGVMLGNGNVGYTLPAEFNTKFIHKRGALAAARQGDDVNPKKESSGCQFYIVHGRIFTNADLDMFEQRTNSQTLQQVKQQVFNALIAKPENQELKNTFVRYQTQGKMDSLQLLLTNTVEPLIQKEMEAQKIQVPVFKFTEEQRKEYTTVGGAPHLDGGYTVFGEVIEGIEVVDKIAAVQVDQMSRPVTDVRILKAKIIK
jgi:peptidylprolyl isomerase